MYRHLQTKTCRRCKGRVSLDKQIQLVLGREPQFTTTAREELQRIYFTCNHDLPYKLLSSPHKGPVTSSYTGLTTARTDANAEMVYSTTHSLQISTSQGFPTAHCCKGRSMGNVAPQPAAHSSHRSSDLPQRTQAPWKEIKPRSFLCKEQSSGMKRAQLEREQKGLVSGAAAPTCQHRPQKAPE